MSEDPEGQLTLLQRLDVALASRLALRPGGLDVGQPEDLTAPRAGDTDADALWASKMLALRGFSLAPEDAAALLSGHPTRIDPRGQEAHLLRGMTAVLEEIRARAANGLAPDGWFAVELFRRLTTEIARFRNNALRRDVPWDGIVGVTYPHAEAVPGLLDRLTEANHYGEEFGQDGLHPVRRAARLLWRLARIAPFPDFNAVIAFAVMDAYLLAKGYPCLTPESGDRALLAHLISGAVPRRVVQFEARLVALVEA